MMEILAVRNSYFKNISFSLCHSIKLAQVCVLCREKPQWLKPSYFNLPFPILLFKSAGPAKESKADKRKKEKKGSKANRPVSSRPAYKDMRPNSAHVDNNFQVKQNANNIEMESSGQSIEENLTNKVNEINLRENGPNENNGEETNDSAEKDSEKSELVPEKSSDCNHGEDLANNVEHVNATEPPSEGEEILDTYHKMKQGEYYWSETSDVHIFDNVGDDDVEMVMMMRTINLQC